MPSISPQELDDIEEGFPQWRVYIPQTDIEADFSTKVEALEYAWTFARQLKNRRIILARLDLLVQDVFGPGGVQDEYQVVKTNVYQFIDGKRYVYHQSKRGKGTPKMSTEPF